MIKLRILLFILLSNLLPGAIGFLFLLYKLCIMGINLFRYIKRLLILPLKKFSHLFDIFFAERFTVGGGSTLFLRNTVSDLRLYRDKIGSAIILFRFLKSLHNSGNIISIFHKKGFKTKSLHPLFYILGKSNSGISFNGNVIRIIKDRQFVQIQCSGKRQRFGRNPLHKTSITAKRVGSMVYKRKSFPVKFCSKMALRHCKAYRHRKSCPQGSRSSIHSGSMAILRMPRGQRIHLPKRHQIFFF